MKIGPPHKLAILQHSSRGWAGNQPFPIQPKVALVDAGGNVVTEDSTTTVTAHITPSLSQTSHVIVDTSNDAIPVVETVSFASSIVSDERILYGPGDAIEIIITFSQEVAVFPYEDDGIPPRIILNVADTNDEEVFAALVVAEYQYGILSRTLQFEYMVKTGHSQNGLDYSSINSLLANDYLVKDAFGRILNLELPALESKSSLSGSKSISISNSRPIVQMIVADLPTGEYGAGEEVNFVVSFDREVSASSRLLLCLFSTC